MSSVAIEREGRTITVSFMVGVRDLDDNGNMGTCGRVRCDVGSRKAALELAGAMIEVTTAYVQVRTLPFRAGVGDQGLVGAGAK